jgi:hypothetical protein
LIAWAIIVRIKAVLEVRVKDKSAHLQAMLLLILHLLLVINLCRLDGFSIAEGGRGEHILGGSIGALEL